MRDYQVPLRIPIRAHPVVRTTMDRDTHGNLVLVAAELFPNFPVTKYGRVLARCFGRAGRDDNEAYQREQPEQLLAHGFFDLGHPRLLRGPRIPPRSIDKRVTRIYLCKDGFAGVAERAIGGGSRVEQQ